MIVGIWEGFTGP